MAYDAETFFDDMVGLFNATDLNTKCTALNTEKAAVGDDAIKTDWATDDFFINFNDSVINRNELMQFGWGDIGTEDSNATRVSEEFKMFFAIWSICTDDETLEMKKLLRYTRALEEIGKEASLNFKTSTLEIDTFKPVTVLDNSDSDWYRAAGIHVTGVIG